MVPQKHPTQYVPTPQSSPFPSLRRPVSFRLLGLTVEGGKFKVELVFPISYPFTPPKFKFITPIYHPNIDDQGAVCLSLLKEGEWKPSTRVVTVLEGIIGLLIAPNPDDPLVASIAETFQNNRYETRFPHCFLSHFLRC